MTLLNPLGTGPPVPSFDNEAATRTTYFMGGKGTFNIDALRALFYSLIMLVSLFVSLCHEAYLCHLAFAML